MKKTVSLALCAVLVLSALLGLSACNHGFDKMEALFADSYIDYAQNVDVNVDKYSILADQGLHIITGYTEDGEPIEVPADNAEAVEEHFDPELPTIIITHGVQLGGGRYGIVHWFSSNRMENCELGSFFKSGDNFYNQKWNVLYFHYERFADSILSVADAGAVEARVWTRGDDGLGSRFVYINGDGQAVESQPDALPYALSEFYAAEYIRLMNAVKSVYPTYAETRGEIRTASHSMGCALTVATVSLLKIVADAGQLENALLPDRMALIDGFVGSLADYTGKVIAWSGKPCIDGNPRLNYYYSLKNIVENADIAVEFNYNTIGFVPFLAMMDLNEAELKDLKMQLLYNEIKEVVAMVQVIPAYFSVGGNVAINGHNGMFEWYMTSYQSGTVNYYSPDDFDYDEETETYSLKAGAQALGIVATASASIEQIKAMRGKEVVMCKTWTGTTTVESDDDLFRVSARVAPPSQI